MKSKQSWPRGALLECGAKGGCARRELLLVLVADVSSRYGTICIIAIARGRVERFQCCRKARYWIR
jgi:hypothetical protein